MSGSSKPPVRLIRRHANRRLYDTTIKRAVTLREVALLVAVGAKVTVVDGPTGEDITRQTLAKIIEEQTPVEGEEPRLVDRMRQLVSRSMGGSMAVLHDVSLVGLGLADYAREKTLRAIGQLKERGGQMNGKSAKRVREMAEKAEARIRKTSEKMKKRGERSKKRAHGQKRSEIEKLRSQIAELKKAMKDLEKKLV